MHSPSLLAAAAAAALLSSPVRAQIAAGPSAASLAPVLVTGNPLRSAETAAPVAVLAGDGLVVGRGASLGETLAGQPGVAASYFGPNANRPVVRGLDGERVGILANGGASFDASALSPDHAVPIDPLVVERIEVLRGPATLAHGGGAVGGVVNVIDNRIPRAPIRQLGGAVEARLGGAAGERGGAALLETGDGRVALHVDAFGRESDDLRVPRFTPRAEGAALAASERVRNSAARASGGAVGVSWTFAGGYLGAALDRHDSRYGIVAEPDVTIRMAREQATLAGEWSASDGPWRTLRLYAGRTRYAHDEIEGSGEVGTRFGNVGRDLKLELAHAPLGALRGVLGLQWEHADFSALGEEAFVPDTRTRRRSAFVVEQLDWALGTLSGGLRLGHETVDSAGDAGGGTPRFGPPASRRFAPRSVSVSQLAPLSPAWALEATLGRHERAPSAVELYADGVHAATAAYERGDASIGLERARHAELALRWQRGEDRLRAGVYTTRFAPFIALAATGEQVEGVPVFAFRAVPARLKGLEIDGRHALPRVGGWALALSGRLDLVRGTALDTGEPLPRLPPVRATLALEAAAAAWSWQATLDHAARQSRVPAGDVATEGHTLLNLSLARRFMLGGSSALWFLRLDNAFDALAFNAATVRTVRELAQLPGRSLKTGLRLAF